MRRESSTQTAFMIQTHGNPALLSLGGTPCTPGSVSSCSDVPHLHSQDAVECTHTFYCISKCEIPEHPTVAVGVTLSRW